MFESIKTPTEYWSYERAAVYFAEEFPWLCEEGFKYHEWYIDRLRRKLIHIHPMGIPFVLDIGPFFNNDEGHDFNKVDDWIVFRNLIEETYRKVFYLNFDIFTPHWFLEDRFGGNLGSAIIMDLENIYSNGLKNVECERIHILPNIIREGIIYKYCNNLGMFYLKSGIIVLWNPFIQIKLSEVCLSESFITENVQICNLSKENILFLLNCYEEFKRDRDKYERH